jgi:GNAT superfamily N-acetyltransferase
MTEPRLRPLAADDHERVREFVRRWAEGLTFESRQERWVADVDGEIVAWAGLIPPADGVAVLDDLWVDPSWIGRGLGKRLFELAADRARELGAVRLEWGAERHALGFYEKMGGRFLREHVTEWGREGRWYGMDL